MNPIDYIPAWATTDEAQCFAYGFAFALLVRFYRSIIRNLKKAGQDRID